MPSQVRRFSATSSLHCPGGMAAPALRGFSAAYAWALPSGERCPAWNGDPRNRRCAIPIVTVRAEVLTGVEGHFPGDLLAGVGGHAAHDRQQRAPGHVLAVVDRPAAADTGEELVMLRLVNVVMGAVVVP